MRRNFNLRTDERKDVYTRITDTIVGQLEAGTRPWVKPWESGQPATRPLRHNAVPYGGINVVLLWMAAVSSGHESPFWMTYRQAQEYGGQVRKGEHGALVVYADRFTRTRRNDDTGEEEEHAIPFLKGYTVFNAAQVEGLPERYYARPPPKRGPELRILHADSYVANTGASVLYGGSRAYYRLDTDQIRMPRADAFPGPEPFYATLLHELTHWTRHPTRLAREFGRKAWGDEGYAQEELVAEIASAFLCADLEITPEVRVDHAAYISSWLKVLKDDTRAVIRAASHAQRAVDYLHRLQPGDEHRPDPGEDPGTAPAP